MNDKSNVIPLTAGAFRANPHKEEPETPKDPEKEPLDQAPNSRIEALEAALLAYADAFAAGPIPPWLTEAERWRQAMWGLKYSTALAPGPRDSVTGGPFMSICHKMKFIDSSPAVYPGSAHADFRTAIEDAFYWAGRGDDAYWGMGAQRTAKEPAEKWPHRRKAIRQEWNTIFCRCLYVDVDVKKDAHTSTREAAETLMCMVRAFGFIPTMIVGSGNGGLHVYWRLDKLVTPKEFAPMADMLKKMAMAHGLKIDPQCTSNVCCLLRVPGTWNFKYATDAIDATPVTLIYGGEKTEPGEA